jgi:hypothetical protein
MEMAHGTSDSLNAEPGTDSMKLAIEFEHFNAEGDGWSFRGCTDEPKTNKCFIDIVGISRMVKSLGVAC